MTPRVLAHRGASAYAPENTLAAFDLAVEMGADAIEIDLVPVAGDLVALHDAPAAETMAPSLEAILSRYGSSTHYAIDLKDPTPAAERVLLDAIERHGAAERVEVMTFWSDSIERLARAAPGLTLVQLYRRAVEPADALADLDRASRFTKAIGRATELVDKALVDAVRGRGLGVYVYVVNDEADMARIVELGATGLVTDVPDRALRFLGR